MDEMRKKKMLNRIEGIQIYKKKNLIKLNCF